MRTIYLLHFGDENTKTPYKHAGHYLGSTDSLAKRIAEHRSGQGARLMAVIKEAGLEFVVARTWKGSRHDERRRKGRGLTPLCPICKRLMAENKEIQEKQNDVR